MLNMSNSVQTLYQATQLDSEQLGLINTDFAFKAPADFLQQIEKNNPQDPLLKQILPHANETLTSQHFSKDPVGDLESTPTPSLIHKYYGRVLLMASPKCDIHCRYCFRRHFPYEAHINQRHWDNALAQIKQDTSIHEVILSGGDPFSLSATVLLKLIVKIETIAHIKTLRIHTRTPIVGPSKAPTTLLLNWAQTTRLNKVLVVHSNHPNELSSKTNALLNQYQQAGFCLLNQSVLLKGVNDCPQTLTQLSHKLFAQGVLPYYLHQLDRVEGALHFEVSDQRAHQLHEQLRQQLPGYLVPKLVREIAGEPYKTLLSAKV